MSSRQSASPIYGADVKREDVSQIPIRGDALVTKFNTDMSNSRRAGTSRVSPGDAQRPRGKVERLYIKVAVGRDDRAFLPPDFRPRGKVERNVTKQVKYSRITTLFSL